MTSPKRLWRERGSCSYVAMEVRPPFEGSRADAATVTIEALPEGVGVYEAMLEVATTVLLSHRLSADTLREFYTEVRNAALKARARMASDAGDAVWNLSTKPLSLDVERPSVEVIAREVCLALDHGSGFPCNCKGIADALRREREPL